MFENLPRLDGTATIELMINGSSVIIEVFGNEAPITAGNFVDLVERGVYDGLAFHRVIKEPNPFVAQGGDPQSANPNFPIESLGGGGFVDPETGKRRDIPLEIKLQGDDDPTYSTQLGRLAGNPAPDVVLEHNRGAVAMARSSLPNSASSQFYFALDELDFLDGDYAVFGNVLEGLDVVDSIEEGDRISDAEVIEGIENLVEGIDTIDLFRFRNKNFETGTYLFTGEAERDSILNDSDLNQTFELEGNGNIAFTAAAETRNDLDLLPFYRLRSLDVSGTYLLVSTGEYEAIFAPDSAQKDKWVKEGLNEAGEDIAEFYLYGAGAGQGVEFHRFQNNFNNTFLFAGPEETAFINGDPNLSATFTDQGIAFESLVVV